MRYGFISDVHANLPALEAALAELSDARVDRVVCAGDLVGYGPHPNECVRRIAAEGIACVAGNHDLMAIGRLGLEGASGLARHTIEWAREVLDDDSRAFLEGLPATLALDELTVAHGSLDSPSVYIETDDAAARELRRLERGQVLVIGHTHVPYAYGARRGRLLRGRAGQVELAGDERCLLNPGSVGQARERRPLTRLLVLDSDRGEASFRAIRYDEPRTRRALVERGLPAGAHHIKPTLRDKAARAKARALRSGV